VYFRVPITFRNTAGLCDFLYLRYARKRLERYPLTKKNNILLRFVSGEQWRLASRSTWIFSKPMRRKYKNYIHKSIQTNHRRELNLWHFKSCRIHLKHGVVHVMQHQLLQNHNKIFSSLKKNFIIIAKSIKIYAKFL